MKGLVLIVIFITTLFSQYSVGDIISDEHQGTSFDVCYGQYPSEELSLFDFSDGNKVIWISLAASW